MREIETSCTTRHHARVGCERASKKFSAGVCERFLSRLSAFEASLPLLSSSLCFPPLLADPACFSFESSAEKQDNENAEAQREEEGVCEQGEELEKFEGRKTIPVQKELLLYFSTDSFS